MSHASGEIIIDNKVVAYFDYSGTADVCVSNLVDTIDEVKLREMPWKYCNCLQAPTPAIIYSSYGYGFYWNGLVCLPYRAIVEGGDPYDLSCGEGMCAKYGCKCILRKEGHPLSENLGNQLAQDDS